MLPNNLPNIGIVILAAGEGKRMRSEVPKVMQPLRGKPLIEYVVRAVEEARLVEKPIIVVGVKHTLVQDYLLDRATYVVQAQQLGTGHAVTTAEGELKGKADQIVVLYGDMPFVKSSSVSRLVEEHVKEENVITFMTITVPNFEEWRRYFYDFSRIVRDEGGRVVKDVQMKDATAAELELKELNTCYFCFRAQWLWERLRQLRTDNKQGEYYLTDLIRMAVEEGAKIGTVAVDEKEAIGVNTKEHLDLAQGLDKAVF